MENDRIDLPTTLKAYFLSLEKNGSLKGAYDRLCALEKRYQYEKYDEEPEPYFAARTSVCKSLLGDTELYKLFPEEGVKGTFESDYCDDMKWREKYHFEKYIPGTLDKEIDLDDPEYKEYREKLYHGTISKICDEYASYIFTQLHADEKEAIEAIGDPLMISIRQVKHYGLLMEDIEPLMEADPFSETGYADEATWEGFFQKQDAALFFGTSKLVELGRDERAARKTIIELAKGSPEVVKEKRSHTKSSLKHR